MVPPLQLPSHSLQSRYGVKKTGIFSGLVFLALPAFLMLISAVVITFVFESARQANARESSPVDAMVVHFCASDPNLY